MPTYTVKGAGIKKENIESQHGLFKTLNLFLQEYGSQEQIAAEWYTKQDTPVPAEGATLEGDITEDPKWGKKFKKTPKNAGFGGGGGMTPERQRAIQRQHSQDMAIQILQLAGSLGLLPDVKETKDLFPLLKATADWCDKDVNRTAEPSTGG